MFKISELVLTNSSSQKIQVEKRADEVQYGSRRELQTQSTIRSEGTLLSILNIFSILSEIITL